MFNVGTLAAAAQPWTPALLFKQGEQGVWYDPSDIERYMAKGPELAVNGGFDSDTAWVKNSPTVAITGGKLVLTAANTSNGAYEDVASLGKWYEVTITVDSVTGGAVRVGLNNDSSSASIKQFTSAGTYTVTLYNNGGTTPNRFFVVAIGTGVNAVVDNVSIRELTGISTATMFQDAAGTTPVTAVEQPVGLILDRRLGAVRGSELIGDVGLDNPGYWEQTAAAVVVAGGVATWTAAGSGVAIRAPLGTTTAGRWYEIEVVVDSISSGGLAIAASMAGSIKSLYVGYNRVILPSDGSTQKPNIYSQGTTTAVVSRFSVREIPGNHASQATTTARPVLSARVNMFPRSDTILWANKTGVTVEPEAVYREDIGSWMLRMLETGTTGVHNTNSDSGGKVPFVAGATVTVSVVAKSIGGRNLRVGGPSDSLIPLRAIFDLNAGTVQSTYEGSTARIESLGDGFFRCSATATCLGTQNSYITFNSVDGSSTSFTGDPSKGLLFGAVDFRYTNGGHSMIPPYQRVNSATNYDTVGFLHYLRFDGVDDSLQTGNIDFTTTDKVASVAGVTNLSDATRAIVFELSGSFTNPGTFALQYPSSDNLAIALFASNGSASSYATSQTGIAPFTAVFAARGDIAEDVAFIRVNAAISGTSPLDQGAGNYGNYPVYIGSRAATAQRFNGHIYQIGIRGAATTDDQLRAWEKAVAKKTGVNL